MDRITWLSFAGLHKFDKSYLTSIPAEFTKKASFFVRKDLMIFPAQIAL